MRTGQSEFALIVGVIVVIVIVAFFALSTSNILPINVPQGVARDQSLVGDTVKNIAREGADLSLEWIEKQGGHIQPGYDNVSFTRVAVSYWQKCDDTAIPSISIITSRLEDGVKNYILNNLLTKTDYFSKNISFNLDDLSVVANIVDNKIDFSVFLPTTVSGYAMSQPYTFSVPTKLKEIYSFAADYANAAAQERYLELYLINSIYFSKLEADGHPVLPTTSVMTKCGETLSRSPAQLSNAMERTVEYTLANTLWWQGINMDRNQPKTYGIENLNGKTYPQLDPQFKLHDYFSIQIPNAVFFSNPRPMFSSMILTSDGLCIGSYSVQYSLSTPVIIRIHDDLTGHDFNFATLLDIKNMRPGDCSAHPPPSLCVHTSTETGEQTDCSVDGEGFQEIVGCINQVCPLNIIANHETMPGVFQEFADASVTFGPCVPGQTNNNGRMDGVTTCSRHDLTIMDRTSSKASERYMFKMCNATPTEASGTHTLHIWPEVTIEFRKVNLTTCTIETINNKATANFEVNKCTHYVNNLDMSTTDQTCITNAGCDPTDLTCISDAQASCNVALGNTPTLDTVKLRIQPGAHSIIAELTNESAYSGAGTGVSAQMGIIKGTFNLADTTTRLRINIPLSDNYLTPDQAEGLGNSMKTNCGVSFIEEI